MRILVIGATGLIGRAVARALGDQHEVIGASRSRAAVHVDIGDPDSVRAMYRTVGRVDAVVSAAGEARFGPMLQLGDEDFALSIRSKLMGQVNLVRYGVDSVADGGSFTLTSGVLAQHPMPGSAAISLVNAGLEGFARAAALDLPRGQRINCVSPPWVSETLAQMGRDPTAGAPADVVARSYVASVEGRETGAILEVPSAIGRR